MCLSESNVQLSGVLLQPFVVAMKMHCQPRLVCAVNLLGEKTSARLRRVKQQSLKKTQKRGGAAACTSSFTESNETSAGAQ